MRRNEHSDLRELFDKIAAQNPYDPSLKQVYDAQSEASKTALDSIIKASRTSPGFPGYEGYRRKRINFVDNRASSANGKIEELTGRDFSEVFKKAEGQGAFATPVPGHFSADGMSCQAFMIGKNVFEGTAPGRLEENFEQHGKHLVVIEGSNGRRETRMVNVYDQKDQSPLTNALRSYLDYNPFNGPIDLQYD